VNPADAMTRAERFIAVPVIVVVRVVGAIAS
jgi:hypothetical protein